MPIESGFKEPQPLLKACLGKDKDEAGVHISSTDAGEDGNPQAWPSPIDEAKLLGKIDRRVLPVLFVFYVLTFLDR